MLYRECVRRRMPEMTKSSIPEDDPIRSLMPNLQPMDKDQVGRQELAPFGIFLRKSVYDCGLFSSSSYYSSYCWKEGTQSSGPCSGEQSSPPWLASPIAICLFVSLSLSLPPSLFLFLSIPHPPQVVCDEPSVMVMERVRWLERNILVAASRVLKHMLAERERVRAERMLEVCGALIDLDTSILSLKIIKHVSNWHLYYNNRCGILD